MDIDRRNFFGIIAAPLLRHVGPPPAPQACFSIGGIIPNDGALAILHQDYVIPRKTHDKWQRMVNALIEPGDIVVNCCFTPNSESNGIDNR